jgi:hypothetical protein
MTRRNPHFWGFFTRFGGTTITFAATGGTYAFVRCFSANIREVDDSWNAAYGGFLAGSIQGLRREYFFVLVSHYPLSISPRVPKG